MGLDLLLIVVCLLALMLTGTWLSIALFGTGVLALTFLGKGGMDSACLEAMRECGCVYLALAGGCSAIYTGKVDRIEREYWPESHKSWADNMLKLNVTDYGPMFVSMDAHGHSLYEGGDSAESRREIIYEKLGIAELEP